MTADVTYRYLVLRSNEKRERAAVGHWVHHSRTTVSERIDDLSTLVTSEGHYLVVPLDEDRRPEEFKVHPGPPVVEAI